MSGYTVVMPFVVEEYKDRCMETCRFDNVLLVDNTVNNVGIMRAHNMGVDKMLADRSDWLIVMSAAIRFGIPGGLDFIEHLKNRSGDDVVEAMDVFGWHLIAFSADTIRAAGRWDENFTPYGFDDLDYSIRIRKHIASQRRPARWEKVSVNIEDAGMGHGIKIGGVKPQTRILADYFRRKWGRNAPDYLAPEYDNPFNNHVNPIKYWPHVMVDGTLGYWDKPLAQRGGPAR